MQGYSPLGECSMRRLAMLLPQSNKHCDVLLSEALRCSQSLERKLEWQPRNNNGKGWSLVTLASKFCIRARRACQVYFSLYYSKIGPLCSLSYVIKNERRVKMHNNILQYTNFGTFFSLRFRALVILRAFKGFWSLNLNFWGFIAFLCLSFSNTKYKWLIKHSSICWDTGSLRSNRAGSERCMLRESYSRHPY